jgi:hypothetical protein
MADTRVELNVFGTAESWYHKEIYWPNCGIPSVWQLEDPYVASGERPNMCVGCNASFFVSSVVIRSEPVNELGRSAILKGANRPKLWLAYKRTAEK